MNYYYLRPGDFRPEALDEKGYKILGYPSQEIARERLREAGNLFSSMEDAKGASFRVSYLLKELADSRNNRNEPKPRRRYVSHLELHEGVWIISYTDKGRMKRLTDLWHRSRAFLYTFTEEYKIQRRPLRFIKSLLASTIRACTFDLNMGQPSASTPTNSVGNDGENTDSPSGCDTST